ncbi:uncharacterized protein LOC131952942 [Physella acuta]|uniref:uncharacterized protein LOC131952942 n=1 Tax=Physella acuta TaxID=109671 RepID=UPI0027DB4875|nr:uncharacterized protein LOC131952942 [Physella acuta]XP_059171861.1 uncharacterized protein LOC131952942 [Physella acuta]XP_059171862.1 uncharacterized protein LOC131952942 [Physella acuta]
MSVSDKAVLALCDEVWKWRLVESPEFASFCGFHQYDDAWDDVSEEAYKKREACIKEFLKKAEGIPTNSCSAEVALSYALLVDDLKQYLKGAQFKSYLMPINYLEGIHNNCNLTISYMKFDTEADFEKYISRLEKLPKRIEQVVTNLQKGIEENIVLHLRSVSRVPKQIDDMLKTPVEELEIFTPLQGDHPNVSKEKLESFQAEAKNLIISKVNPAFQTLKDFLENEYMKHLRQKEGISSLANGDEWYQQCLDYHLSYPMTPQQVHDLGLKEVGRIKQLILEAAKKEGLGENLPAILEAVVERQKSFFKTREEVLDYVKDLCYNKIRPRLAKLFKNLPDSQMTIIPAPEYMKNSPAGYYLGGTPDGSRKGIYYINNHNLEECYPYQLPALSLHEGEPGHHLQAEYALTATHLPDFRRYCEDMNYYLPPAKFALNTAYVEGWGLYSESLGEELNIYTDTFDLLGRYNFEIFRAARLVVDTGLHAFGWSKEQAVQYMTDNTLSVQSEMIKEVDRYITWPGQACAYKVGEIKFWELRHKAEAKLGSKFDVKEFHHRVLSCGSVPLHVLEHIVDKFIEETSSASGEGN